MIASPTARVESTGESIITCGFASVYRQFTLTPRTIHGEVGAAEFLRHGPTLRPSHATTRPPAIAPPRLKDHNLVTVGCVRACEYLAHLPAAAGDDDLHAAAAARLPRETAAFLRSHSVRGSALSGHLRYHKAPPLRWLTGDRNNDRCQRHISRSSLSSNNPA